MTRAAPSPPRLVALFGAGLVCVASLACSLVGGVDDLQSGPAAGGGSGGATGGAGPSSGGAGPTATTGGAGPTGSPASVTSTSTGVGPCVACEPTGPCDEVTCDAATGECVHATAPSGTPCDDGNGCTAGDACDGAGTCAAGPVCPNDDPCKTVSCKSGNCAASAKPNGTSCGGAASKRCCGGGCVDVSTDPDHCGACAATCGGKFGCESVAATNTCAQAPGNTAGRCTCQFNTDCPIGQVCRAVTPFAMRCTPNDANACADASFVDLEQCPNFCRY